ncbi:MAG: PLP-dependent transferase [Oscillospiraceae bacterium]|nr:PLP-dependent transferase [Oscillospiraceae bacterium]
MVSAVEQKMTQLEGSTASAVCASGMAAISSALLNLVRAKDEIVAAAGLYSGTVELLRSFEALGIHTRYVPKNTVSEYEKRINGKTRVVFAETIGNPRLDVTDVVVNSS